MGMGYETEENTWRREYSAAQQCWTEDVCRAVEGIEVLCKNAMDSAAGRSASMARTSAGSLKHLGYYRLYLVARGMRANTISKYMRDARKFLTYSHGQELTPELTVRYQEYLMGLYQPASANSMLVGLNRFLVFLGRLDYCVRLFRIQQTLFRDASRELTMEEYQRLVQQARRDGNRRLFYILQTLGSTGIRIGELPSITVESLDQKTVSVCSKGKIRQILLPRTLIQVLKEYCIRTGLASGSIFVTRSGKPVDRRNVWRDMKKLCKRADVPEDKVFPHNLRHLFACSFYEKKKDIVRLADYLGHSSVETTRRYTQVAIMEEQRKQLELGFLADDWDNADTGQEGAREHALVCKAVSQEYASVCETASRRKAPAWGTGLKAR